MRHFTRTHNDLKWLFPIAKTKAEANEVFSYVEEMQSISLIPRVLQIMISVTWRLMRS